MTLRSRWSIPTLVALALVLGGCEQNAILEIKLDLPPRPDAEFPDGEQVFGVVQIREAQLPFDEGWAPEARDYPGTPLTDMRQEVRYSAVSSRDDIGVRMKVRFCSGDQSIAEFCAGEDESRCAEPRAVFFDFERPFYLGKRTRWEYRIEEVPAPACPDERQLVTVGKCEVEGCIQDPTGSGTYCRSDDTHFCE